MSQTGTDVAPPTGAKPAAMRAPPLSPHLQVWRWHVTMAGSIATRATGVALYGGAMVVTALVLALACGPRAYQTALDLLHAPLGLLVLFGIATSLFYHMAAGVRHLAWDSGRGFQPRTANLSGIACFVFGIAGAGALFAWALLSGAV